MALCYLPNPAIKRFIGLSVRHASSFSDPDPFYGHTRHVGRQYPVNQYDRVKRIILVRHGESIGNSDESAYVNTADWRIPLTKKGREQAEESGKYINELIGDKKDKGKVFFYVSPYTRTKQTLQGIMKHIDQEQIAGIREEPRISEQQFGNFQCTSSVLNAKEERKQFGRFYYRFPNGEAGFDVYSRVTSFISTVMRDVVQLKASGHDMENFNICIVTHGLTLRLFLTRWFQFSVQEFEESFNPDNGAVIVLERKTNPITKLQHFEISNQEQLDHLNLPCYQKQSRFRLIEDLRNFKGGFDEDDEEL